MREIEWLAFSDPMKRKGAHRVSPSFTKKAQLFQDLPLLLEQEHPPAELAQLLALIAGQAVALAALDLGLLHPHPQRNTPRSQAISPRVRSVRA